MAPAWLEPSLFEYTHPQTGKTSTDLGWALVLDDERSIAIPHTRATEFRRWEDVPAEIRNAIIRDSVCDHAGANSEAKVKEYAWLKARSNWSGECQPFANSHQNLGDGCQREMLLNPRFAAAEVYYDSVTKQAWKAHRFGSLAVREDFAGAIRSWFQNRVLIYDDQFPAEDVPFADLEWDFAKSQSSLVGETDHPLGHELLHMPLLISRSIEQIVVKIEAGRLLRGILGGFGMLCEIRKCAYLTVRLLDKNGKQLGLLLVKGNHYELRNVCSYPMAYYIKKTMPTEAADEHWSWAVHPATLPLRDIVYLEWSENAQKSEAAEAAVKFKAVIDSRLPKHHGFVGLAAVFHAR